MPGMVEEDEELGVPNNLTTVETSSHMMQALARAFLCADAAVSDAAFRKYDLDGSGCLCPGELCAAIKVR